jgi:hypothetical protein
MTSKDKYIKPVPNSRDSFARLKQITDDAQAGKLKPWSPAVIDLLEAYNINVQRLKDAKAQASLSFPMSIPDHRSIAIGFRYAKDAGTFAEDLFVFTEDVGLTCYYRGSQEDTLPEYAGTHHAAIKLSEVLPDFQRQLADMQQQIDTVRAQTSQPTLPSGAKSLRNQALDLSQEIIEFIAQREETSPGWLPPGDGYPKEMMDHIKETVGLYDRKYLNDTLELYDRFTQEGVNTDDDRFMFMHPTNPLGMRSIAIKLATWARKK